jgi:hypothetical protein
MSILKGLTNRDTNPSVAISNPGHHSPFVMHNFGTIQVVGPDGNIKERKCWSENIACTQGLVTLAKLVATGGEASGWISAAAIGTDTTAANSTQSTLGASTAIVHRSQASMVGSDAGNMTAAFNLTFASNNPAGAAAIHEIGLFGTNAATNKCVARKVLGTASVNKGASDVINATYSLVFTTA